jgi:FkbM family methyltransferase
LKSVTFLNLTKKSVSRKIPLTVWKYGDCTVKVRFLGGSYYFFLPTGYDFNVFLNPYFHEYEITQLIFRSLSPGDAFLDVGAHGGLYTIIAGMKVKETGKVLCFEPNPLNLIFLRLNIKLNGLNNVNVIPKAVGDKSGRMRLYYPTHRTALTSANGMGENMIEVGVTTIDEVAEKLDFVKVMKVDTQGYDWNVLKGASKTLRKVRFVIVQRNASSIRKLLLNAGFQLSILRPSGNLFAANKLF